MILLAQAAAGQFIQQGEKLVGGGAVGSAHLGSSVAISADGNTAIVGGPTDNDSLGAAWVFTRAQGSWSQEGPKLFRTDLLAFEQGSSVAVSADGNTAIVGARGKWSSTGAALVYTRSNGVWSQQGIELVGTDAVGAAGEGMSVAVSADGNTAVVGGYWDSFGLGAAWVFTRSGGVWSQQGGKLVGTGALGAPMQGWSVAISADGNAVIVGGPGDNGAYGAAGTGAAWVYRRSGGSWRQQGDKLVGTGAEGLAGQGNSVAISADGGTAIVGGELDNSQIGAAWVFTCRGGVWSQQGGKLVGTGAVRPPWLGVLQGQSVSISADGNTTIVGGMYDNSQEGAAWVYTRSGGVWAQLGSKLLGFDATLRAEQGGSVAISADGSTAIVGGSLDGGEAGAAWVFSATTFGVWVPVASHTPGKNNSQWRSDLGLLNTSTVQANLQIEFFGSGGVVSNATYVPPGTQSILTDVVGQLNASGSAALEILSDQPLKVTARSYNQVAADASCYAGGTQGQDYPAVVTGNGLVAGQSAYLGGLSESSTYRSNIGLVNTGTGIATALVELFDGSGAKLTDYTVTLNPGDWKQETEPFLNRAGQMAMDRGYAKVTAQTGSGVFAFASVIDNITNDPTTVTMQR